MDKFVRLPELEVQLVHPEDVKLVAPKPQTTRTVGRSPVNLEHCVSVRSQDWPVYFPGRQPAPCPAVFFDLGNGGEVIWVFQTEGERDRVLEALLAMMPPPLIY